MSVSDGKNGLVSGVGNTPFMGPTDTLVCACVDERMSLQSCFQLHREMITSSSSCHQVKANPDAHHGVKSEIIP